MIGILGELVFAAMGAAVIGTGLVLLACIAFPGLAEALIPCAPPRASPRPNPSPSLIGAGASPLNAAGVRPRQVVGIDLPTGSAVIEVDELWLVGAVAWVSASLDHRAGVSTRWMRGTPGRYARCTYVGASRITMSAAAPGVR